jgi:hypothetical protein
MKTYELLQESDPFTVMKGLQAEFKQLAADMDLTIVAGMGWPQAAKGGAWYGGGLFQKGGKNAKVDTIGLPVESRIKGFIKVLAKKLEAMMADGYTVKIAPGAERGKGTVDVARGEAAEKLQAGLLSRRAPGNVTNREPMPCVSWFVSDPADMVGQMAFRLTVMPYARPTGSEAYGQKQPSVELGGSMPEAKAKELDKRIKAIQKGGQNIWRDGAHHPPAPEGLKKKTALIKAAAKLATNADKPLADNIDVAATYIDSTLKILTKTTTRVDQVDMAIFYNAVMAIK